VAEIQSLARGLLIMDLVANSEEGVSITELAEALDIDKSSASRLVKTLVSYDFVQQKSGSRRFILGKRLYKMSWQLLNRMPVREKAKPYLYRLMQSTGECAHTGVYSEGKALVIDDVEAEASLRVAGGIGRLLPMHCTALGKSLLAFSDIPFPTELNYRTPRTLVEREQLMHEIEETRLRGYSFDDEENDAGVRCLAAPVYDYTGMTIAAIGISGPTVRVTYERVPLLAEQVMETARQLSTDLGYTGRGSVIEAIDNEAESITPVVSNNGKRHSS
jgi:IclR family KDG regulon transcriptional repressor